MTDVARTSSGQGEGDVLSAIVAATRRIVADRKASAPAAALERAARDRQPLDFAAAIRRAERRSSAQSGRILPVPGERPNVIAECKRRSPSRGILRRDYDAAAIAKGYESAGAAAISVLTEPAFFDGALGHLAAVRHAVRVPILRKDFIVDEYQLLEARANGADAILLIVAALTADELRALRVAAQALALAALVEVHDEAELGIALDAGAEIVGVNNRNLKTLDVDIDASARLIEQIPDGVIAVAESGLKTGADLETLRATGYDAFLVGEQLMTAANPATALGALLCA